MSTRVDFEWFDDDSSADTSHLGGSNFLVSAVMMLKRQKRDLQAEVVRLKDRLETLERQNAAFIEVSAERLITKSSRIAAN